MRASFLEASSGLLANNTIDKSNDGIYGYGVPRRGSELLLDEHTGDDGVVMRTIVRNDDDGCLLLECGGESLPLPDGALSAVMRRFGKPLEEREALNIDERFDLPGGASLERFRFLSRYDVIARDYLLYREQGHLPVCELATSVTAALLHLARASAKTRARGEPDL